MKQIVAISSLIIMTAFGINTRRDAKTYGVSRSMGTLAESAKNDSDPLIQMEQEWNQALKTHDIAWFEKNLADDFTDISSGNGGLTTKGDDIANLKGDKTVYDSLELSNLKARVDGNAGIVTGMNHLRGHDEQGQGFDVRLSFTDTYIKRHGHWQAWASQHTRVRP